MSQDQTLKSRATEPHPIGPIQLASEDPVRCGKVGCDLSRRPFARSHGRHPGSGIQGTGGHAVCIDRASMVLEQSSPLGGHSATIRKRGHDLKMLCLRGVGNQEPRRAVLIEECQKHRVTWYGHAPQYQLGQASASHTLHGHRQAVTRIVHGDTLGARKTHREFRAG
jgi:hypothetical protein